jgi:hypothetical protein
MKKTYSRILEAVKLASVSTGLETQSGLQQMIQSMTSRSGLNEAARLASVSSSLENQSGLQQMIQSITSRSGLNEAARLASVSSRLEIQSGLQQIIQSMTSRLGLNEAARLASVSTGLENQSGLQQMIQSMTSRSGLEEAVKFHEHISGLNINNMIESSIYSIIDKYSPISDFIKELPQDKIIINQGETISCAGEVFDLNSLQDLVKQIILNSGVTQKYRTIENNMEIIINEIRQLRQPLLEKIIIYLIIPIIIAFFTSCYGTAIKDISHRHIIAKTQKARNIQIKINKSELDKQVLINYRLVIANSLNVREKEKNKSKLIGRIYFGQVVKVITRKRDWTLVEWADSSGVKYYGWVFTRYLKKF